MAYNSDFKSSVETPQLCLENGIIESEIEN